MNSIVVKKEVMETIVGKVSVLSGKENKVRFNIGLKATDEGLASTVCIVNGGAMTEIGFKTLPLKEKAKLQKGEVYMKFIVKASDFVQRAGALLSMESDVTITETENSILFTCKDGVKVPILKVNEESAEQMLAQDYDKALCKVIAGKAFMEVLHFGGYHALSADERFASVVLSFFNSQASIYSVSGISAGKFICPVEIPYIETVENISEENKTPSEETNKLLQFLKDYCNKLPEEKKSGFIASLAPLSNSPDKLMEIALSCGYQKEEKGSHIKPVYAALTTTNYQMAIKLFSGVEKIMLLVTPNNLHITGGCLKATFALTGINTSITTVFDRFESLPFSSKMVVDRDELISSLSLMKLGDSQTPTCYKGLKSSVSFEKEGITSRVSVTSASGEVTKVKGAFNSALITQALNHLKPGSILIKYAGEGSPLCISNGDLEEKSIAGFHYVMGVSVKGKAKEEAEETE